MAKLDFKKTLGPLYKTKPEPTFVTLSPMSYLQIDGQGLPNSQPFADAIQALFSVAFKTKFMCKKQWARDYVVMPLEGLSWADDMNDFFAGNKEK